MENKFKHLTWHESNMEKASEHFGKNFYFILF